jgi:hypothetical protein
MWLKPSAHTQHALCVPYKAPLATAQRMTAWLDEDQQLCVVEEVLRALETLIAAAERHYLTKVFVEMSKTTPPCISGNAASETSRCASTSIAEKMCSGEQRTCFRRLNPWLITALQWTLKPSEALQNKHFRGCQSSVLA